MKKLCFLLFVFFIAVACKKKTSTTTNPLNTTTITNFSVDGQPVSNLTHNTFMNGGNFALVCYGLNSNPEIQITFSGTVTPSYGTYAITNGTVTYAKCNFTLSDTGYTEAASSGYINVTTNGAAPYNVATFSNVAVSGNAGNHTISGTITY